MPEFVPSRRIRRRTRFELVILVALTIVFLLVFPQRGTFVNMGLALLALAGIAVTAGDTRRAVWGEMPRTARFRGLGQSCRWMIMMTAPLIAVFLIVGTLLGYRAGGWSGAAQRILDPRLLVAFFVYFPWALAQQTLFQFYLLGRIRTLFPGAPAIGLALATGTAYGLVHLPDVPTTIVTVPAGVVWSLSYWKHRRLLPLAASHAALGATFYFWALGRDLVDKALAPFAG